MPSNLALADFQDISQSSSALQRWGSGSEMTLPLLSEQSSPHPFVFGISRVK